MPLLVIVSKKLSFRRTHVCQYTLTFPRPRPSSRLWVTYVSKLAGDYEEGVPFEALAK